MKEMENTNPNDESGVDARVPGEGRTNDELNRWLHANVMGWSCRHTVLKPLNGIVTCPLCGLTGFVDQPYDMAKFELWQRVPKYCESLDAVRKVEEKVVLEERLAKSYFEYLCYATQDETWRPEYEKRNMVCCLDLALATAHQRAVACKQAWEDAQAVAPALAGT